MTKPPDVASADRNGLAGKTIVELLPVIGDKGTGNADEAVAKVLEMGLDAAYPALEAAVRNDDHADLRNGAMEALVAFGDQAVPRLVRLLKDNNEEVRNFSTVMLGSIGCRSAVDPLIDALGDPAPNVRHGAAEALGRIGDRRAIQPLRTLLAGDTWDRWYASASLGLLESAGIPRRHA